MQCIICKSGNLEKLKTTRIERFSTGDRKNFYPVEGSKIEHVICKECGTVQFLQNEDYKKAVEIVFQKYDVLNCKMWSLEKKECRSRLMVIYEKISKAIQLPEKGNMLDIGCGGGESLFCFNQMYPQWDLNGMDIGEQFREQVLHGNNVKQFYSSLEEMKNENVKFDFISINDVLCVSGNAAQILDTVHDLLADDGVFFVKDTDFEVHPWMLYGIETCLPFTKIQMENVLKRYGFDILDINLDMGGDKEIGIFCKRSRSQLPVNLNFYERNKEIYNKKIAFLDSVIDTVEVYLQKSEYIGIFGTSTAGVWLSEIIARGNVNCADKRIFYIEEDEEILQKKIGVNGYPIYSLEEVVEPAIIFLPFPQYIAESIKKRCEKEYNHLQFILFG